MGRAHRGGAGAQLVPRAAGRRARRGGHPYPYWGGAADSNARRRDAGKLASEAARQQVKPGALARSLIAQALDEPAGAARATSDVGDPPPQPPSGRSGDDPEVELLANGDLLVPVAAANGAWKITRLAPDAPGYARWLSFVQKRDRGPGVLARGIGFWSAAILVLVGTWIGFVVFAVALRAVFS